MWVRIEGIAQGVNSVIIVDYRTNIDNIKNIVKYM
jgi:hypothetical protein